MAHAHVQSSEEITDATTSEEEKRISLIGELQDVCTTVIIGTEIDGIRYDSCVAIGYEETQRYLTANREKKSQNVKKCTLAPPAFVQSPGTLPLVPCANRPSIARGSRDLQMYF